MEPVPPGCGGGVLVGGDTGGVRCRYGPAASGTALCRLLSGGAVMGWGPTRLVVWWWAWSTLLGPEGTTAKGGCGPGGAGRLGRGGCCGWVGSSVARRGLAAHTASIVGVRVAGGRGGRGFGGWSWVVGWSLVENCTVDASILFSVVKLSRADGGCLGTRSR